MLKNIILVMGLSAISSVATAHTMNAAPVQLGGVDVAHVTQPGSSNSGTIDISKLNTFANLSVWNIECQYHITGNSDVTAISLLGSGATVQNYPGTINLNGTSYDNSGIKVKSGTISWEGVAPYPGMTTGLVIRNMDSTNDISVSSCEAILVKGL